jgi:hypothetical protein
VAGNTDLIIILDLYDRLRETIARMGKEYGDRVAPTSGVNHNKLYHSYRMGAVETLNLRLKQLKKNTEPTDARNAFNMTGTELMVIKNEAVNHKVDELFPKVKNSKGKTRVETNAFEQGIKDGKTMSLHASFSDKQDGPIRISH